MKIKGILCAAALVVAGTAWAAPQPEIASDSMQLLNQATIEVIAQDMANEPVRPKSTEVFMELKNIGNNPHIITGATSPIAKQVQLHRFIMRNDKKMMEQIKQIVVAPHSEEDLKPGSFHVMLIGLQDQVAKGQLVPITLSFADGSWMTVQATAG